MHLSVYLPLLFSGLFGFAAPRLARQLPPAAATWLLSGGALLAAIGSTATLALLGLTLVGQAPVLADSGRWSDDALRALSPVPAAIAGLAVAGLGALMPCVGHVVVQRVQALRDAYRLARLLPPLGSELVVTNEPTSQAYAVPGWPGRIVISAGLLRRLDAEERRAVLAHERSHLAHRHHIHQAVAQIAASANPLLRLIPPAVALTCERWADEDAATTCRREAVANAVTRAAVARPSPSTSAVVLAAAAGDVTHRVGALEAPPPRLIRWRVAVLLGLVAATACTVADAAHDTQRLFELAETAYGMGRR
jgi:Peptidase family M48